MQFDRFDKARSICSSLQHFEFMIKYHESDTWNVEEGDKTEFKYKTKLKLECICVSAV